MTGGKTGTIHTMNQRSDKKTEQNPPKSSRPTLAVIGAGIFGTNIAIELAKDFEVTIFEAREDIMQEASYINQYRHHWGYHYPRSVATVHDISEAIPDFEKYYDKAIIRKFPTYYCVAKDGSRVSAQDYLEFCRQNQLPFALENPDPEFINQNKIGVSLKTFEPIYHYRKLKDLVNQRLSAEKNITLRLGTRVTNATITKDGKKTLALETATSQSQEIFDYVINCTYARQNEFCTWLGFPIKPLRIDYVEALIVRLPIDKISLAVMDGQFTNLVPTCDDNLFTLVHISESILERYVPTDGLVRKVKPVSRFKSIMAKSAEWFPIIKKAEYVESRYVFRAVNAYREHDDARPSDIIEHGLGCWSVLGGKIVNCVSLAKKLSIQVKKSSKL